MGLLVPTKGRILINGVDLTTLQQETWAGSRIAACVQNLYVFSDSLRENISFGRKMTDDYILEIARQVCLQTVIGQSAEGLSAFVGDRGITLSGGERQRIGLARLLARTVDVYLLDEALSAVDNQTEKKIRMQIGEIIRNRKGTVIMSAHKLATVRDSDKIIVLDHGGICTVG